MRAMSAMKSIVGEVTVGASYDAHRAAGVLPERSYQDDRNMRARRHCPPLWRLTFQGRAACPGAAEPKKGYALPPGT